jgi:hypothetical protein
LQLAVVRTVVVWRAGIPESGAVQEILHWQCNTVRMMYGIVGDAIRAKGVLPHNDNQQPAPRP